MSEEKKSAVLEEVKVAAQKEREAILKEKEEVKKNQQQLDSYKKLKEEEALSLKHQLESQTL